MPGERFETPAAVDAAPVALANRLPQVVSLFSGAGGLDKGFTGAGFEIPIAFDVSADAVATLSHNFPGVDAIEADLGSGQVEDVVTLIKKRISTDTAIGVIGGPPCQGFSRANSKPDPDDPRNRLVMSYLAVIDALTSEYQVDFVLFENVLGLLDKRNAHILAALTAKLSSMGFVWRTEAFCASDFGVPQRRKRVIISAFRTEDALRAFVPEKRPGLAPTVRDVIENLPAPVFFHRGADPGLFPAHRNHWTMNPRSPKFASGSGQVGSGRSFRRLAWDAPSPTVAYGHREIHVHPEGNRRLSIFEAMRLQGFPDDFEIIGNFSAQVQMVSNAVPPPMALALAQAVARSTGSTGLVKADTAG